MRRLDPQPVGQLCVVAQAAMAFGLSEHEIWEAVVETCGPDSLAIGDDPLDGLTAVLAGRILDRERSAMRSRQRP